MGFGFWRLGGSSPGGRVCSCVGLGICLARGGRRRVLGGGSGLVGLDWERRERQTDCAPGVDYSLYWGGGAWGAGVEEILGEAEVVLLSLGNRHGDVLDFEQDGVCGRGVDAGADLRA